MAVARREQREVINRYLRVFDRNTNQFIGYLVDITPLGAMLQSREQIEPERRMLLRVELPEELDPSRELVIEAASVWDKKEENALFHHTGFRFENVTPVAQGKIRRMIEMYRLEGLGG
ncbi:MAG: PilZ domain-containing protein [Xanthomonadaceae bacterium]|nr:PilZ domain-containing protein [Xanthomonadaceae bacterium]